MSDLLVPSAAAGKLLALAVRGGFAVGPAVHGSAHLAAAHA